MNNEEPENEAREELVNLLLRHGHLEWDRFDAETVADVILTWLSTGEAS